VRRTEYATSSLGICFRKKAPEQMRITAYHPTSQISLVKRYDSIGSGPERETSGTDENRGRDTFDWGV
jgi:hypothetical protein